MEEKRGTQEGRKLLYLWGGSKGGVISVKIVFVGAV